VESRPVAEPQAEPRKDQGDPVAPARKAPATKTPAKKAAATKAPAKKTAAKKAPAKKTAAKTAPAKKAAAKKTAATKAPAKKTAATKTPAKKAPAKKAPATKAPAKKAADLATVEDSSVETPVGTTGADPATNPDTTESDLQQPGTAPLMDPSLTSQVKSEAETAARASDVEKG
jgi:DNA-binding protein HU-beta